MSTAGVVHVEAVIAAPPTAVFAWLADSRNYRRAPLVLSSVWRQRDPTGGFGVGAVRDMVLLAGWFREQIMTFEPDHRIDYRVVRSFPPVRQEVSTVLVAPHPDGSRVTWHLEVEALVPLVGPALSRRIAPIAGGLYASILKAASRATLR